MPITSTEVFEMDRRQLLRLTGAMGIGATFINPHELYAAGECDKILIANGEVNASAAGATLQFWIDGLHFGPASDLKSRANITLFMDLKQSSVSYVESVVLTDENKNTIGARYFDSSMKMKNGHVPYVRFENIELDHTKTYYVIYSVKNSSKIALYTAAIKNPEISKINTTWLPQKMKDHFKTFLIGGANPTPGLITTQFQFYTRNSLELHTARGRVKHIDSSTGDFSVNIEFMHGDAGDDHYMRYFIVMDPVGRLLGFHYRTPPGNAKLPAGTTWDVGKITAAQKTDYNITPTTEKLQVGDIRDCPYIQIYTEDSYDAVARTLLRIR